MKSTEPVRTAVAVAGLAMARVAYADGGGISNAGWMSMLGVVGIVGILYWVYRKVG